MWGACLSQAPLCPCGCGPRGIVAQHVLQSPSEREELCLGFGGGALKSDGVQHLWAPGRETLEFWEPSLPWGKMVCLLSPALPLPCWVLHA